MPNHLSKANQKRDEVKNRIYIYIYPRKGVCVCVYKRNQEKWHFRIANFISAFPSERSEWQQVNNKLAKVAAAFTIEELTTS